MMLSDVLQRAIWALALGCAFMLVLTPTVSQAGSNTAGFGLGVQVGQPTGLNGKYWLSGASAIQASLAWSLDDSEELSITGDYIWHKMKLGDSDFGFYFGVGGRWVAREDSDDTFGARVPIGLDWLFPNSAFDVFGELVPMLNFTPDFEFDFGGTIGGRFFF